MSERCPFRRIWRGFWVSPTYCKWQRVHSIRYTTLQVLQSAVARMLNVRPVWVLCIVVPGRMCWHVKQRLLPHGELPLASWRCGGCRLAFTSKSRRFFGRLYAIIGFSGSAFFSLEDAWRSGRCVSVRRSNFGRCGWNVVTSGTRVEGSLIGLEVSKSVLLTECTWRSCRFMKEDSYPRCTKCE